MHESYAPTRRRLLATSCALAVSASPGAGSAAEGFPTWLRAFRAEAVRAGIARSTLERAFDGVEPIPRVIELDRKQPESRMSFAEYRGRVVSDARIRRGRELRRQHAAELVKVRDRYGVPAEIVVALWGVESGYGEHRGKFRVVDALATLAWEGRRASFFRKELLSALRILDAGDVRPDAMYGSWAGAMGQCQFMPSTFLSYAVDGDGDGRRDIWDTLPDVFASIANYLAGAGWSTGDRWGREVRLSSARADLRTGLDHKAPLTRWAELGVRPLDDDVLPTPAMTASLLDMGDGGGPSFLVYDNFRTLMRWNRSTYFALSVGLISDMLRAG
jgi:membrane-bound lytic murein transglycosylase B